MRPVWKAAFKTCSHWDAVRSRKGKCASETGQWNLTAFTQILIWLLMIFTLYVLSWKLDVIAPHLSFRRNFLMTLGKMFWTTERVQNEKWVVSNTNMISARDKFNPKSQEFREDWVPEYTQECHAGRRELGKENSYSQCPIKIDLSMSLACHKPKVIFSASLAFPNSKAPHATPTASSC